MLVQHFTRVKEFVYIKIENITDYSTQAFTHWVQTMQWKAAHKIKATWSPLGAPGKYPLFPPHPPSLLIGLAPHTADVL